MEDLRRHVVVRQDDGIAFRLERADRLDERRVVRPLHRGDDVFEAGIDGRHLGLERWRPRKRSWRPRRSLLLRSKGSDARRPCQYITHRSTLLYARAEHI